MFTRLVSYMKPHKVKTI
ncbi:hypothetical protein CXB51_031689 [Gossypium anomalum]|uniref:Uncharacterized protein n=1 Tax=Gossypium anomalum TaxID=47600 RepID=A0A8J5Y124_9ROSI|nr:hypothetical protein CXB51_031689 [Gossypium anomalum]